MSRSSEYETLLADVVAGGLRDESLGVLLQMSRRRRVIRRVRRGAAAAVVVVALGVFSWRSAHVERPYTLIRTSALSVSTVVDSGEFVEVTTDCGTPVPVIESGAGNGGISIIGDDELLSRYAPEGSVLVRTGPDSQELVLAEAEPE
jgi:hypothetical protein